MNTQDALSCRQSLNCSPPPSKLGRHGRCVDHDRPGAVCCSPASLSLSLSLSPRPRPCQTRVEVTHAGHVGGVVTVRVCVCMGVCVGVGVGVCGCVIERAEKQPLAKSFRHPKALAHVNSLPARTDSPADATSGHSTKPPYVGKAAQIEACSR